MLNELEALVILTGLQLGAKKIRLLIEQFGSALSVLESEAIDQKTWRQDSSWKRNLELVDKHHAKIISFKHPDYPKRLLEIPDFPILLYVKGELSPSDQQSLAVVGTRNASIYGKEMAEKLSREIASAGVTIVSGLARGIDTAAHRGALHGGRTIGIIGSGLADIYPRENVSLAEQITERGALISEFPMSTPPERHNFPQRNRIVSGMTRATLLIEAPIKSGAMITVEKAEAQGRPIFALPGRADCDDFRGNHLLIKQKRAQLVENSGDLLPLFDHLMVSPLITRREISLDLEEKNFITKLPNQELSFDEIVQITQLPVMKVNSMTLSLVLKKVLKEFPGKIYKKAEGVL